ncbi:MAG: IS200/IS605 family transposase [Gemmataceae bacterium]
MNDMSHSRTNLLYHLVFATKGREAWLDDALRPALFEQIGAILKKEGGMLLRVNGMPDHIHILAKRHQDHRVSDILRDIKARTSGWIHRTRDDLGRFHWQTGYGAFTVSQSHSETVGRYIDNQEEHHRGQSLEEEFLGLCRKHGIEMDTAAVWD